MARLGQLLVRADLVSENNLARALGIQHFAGGRLGTLLLERGSIDEDNLGQTLALQHGCEYIPWRVLSNVSPVVIAALPAKFAVKHAAIPYDRGENYLKLALRDPGDLRILDELFFVTGRKILAGVAPEVRIYQALEKYYGERRTPRYAILAEKLSRPTRARTTPSVPPPPPEFFPSPRRKAAAPPGPLEVWGDAVEPDTDEPQIIQTWKVPEQQLGGWAGTLSPGMDESLAEEPEAISWEEMPAVPSLWLPEPHSVPAGTPPEPESPPVQPDVSPTHAEPPPPLAPSSIYPASVGVETPEAFQSPESSWASPWLVRPSFPGTPAAPPAPPPFERSEPVAAEVSPEAAPAPAVAASAPPSAAKAAKPEPVEIPSAASPLRPRPAPMLAMPSASDFPDIVSATDRDSIATASLLAVGRRFLRGAVFVAKPDCITCWAGAGEQISLEKLRDIMIPWTEPSVFLNVRLSRSFYLGPLPPLPRHEAIAIAMGGWPDECLVQPVMIKEKPVAFLYAEFTRDHGATPMDLAYMRELAAAASSAFVSAIRLKKTEI